MNSIALPRCLVRLPARLICAILLCSLLMQPGQADAKRQKEVSTPMIVLQARSIAQTDRLDAVALLEDYLAGDAKSELLPWVALEAGEQRRLMSDTRGAREHFLSVQRDYPDHLLGQAATMGITLVNGGERPSGNQLATLSLLEALGAPPSMDADRYRLLAIDASASGDRASKIRNYAAKAQAYARESADPLVLARVTKSMARVYTPGGLDADPDQPPPPEAEADQALEQAWLALDDGDLDSARASAEIFLATFPESPSTREAEYVIRRVDAGNPIDAHLVGVLLPLSGTYAPPGQRLKRVIEMANRHAGSPMRLVFMDTQGDAEHTVDLIEQLVLDSGAVAILGPLLKENATVASEVAQALHVPLTCLSQAEGLTADRPFVFRGFLTPSQQTEALVEQAMSVLGIQRFAILAPDNSYGKLAAEAFNAEVSQRGGEVLQQVFYDPTLGDFRKPAAELAAKDYEARSWEFHKLKEDAEERGMDPDKVVLPPLVEYEAIFIPDAYQRVPLVASSLAYEEFAVGAFKPRKDDVPLLLMGLNGWHNDALAVDGGKYVRGGILVDAFDLEDEALHVKSFVASFRQEFERDPGVVDALGYDAARMVAMAVAEGPSHRSAMRDLLAAVELPDSVSGGIRFSDDGEVERSLVVFEVGEESIERWTDEPEEDEEPPQ